MAAFTRAKQANRKNPFEANKVGSAGFTIGGTAADATRTVAVQLKDEVGKDLIVRGKVRGYLAGDANGDTLSASAPSGGITAGTDGLIVNQVDNGNAVIVKGSIQISATAEKFKTTATAIYRIGGVVYTKAATDNLVFSAAHVVGAAKYGVVLVQINAAGTVTTKVPLTPQVYTSAVLALAALPLPDAGNVMLGYITLDNSGSDGSAAGAWTAITDDLTDTGDITDSGFVDAPEVNSSRTFEAVSEADGDLDVAITEAGVKTFYLVLELPNGAITVSSAIAFT